MLVHYIDNILIVPKGGMWHMSQRVSSEDSHTFRDLPRQCFWTHQFVACRDIFYEVKKELLFFALLPTEGTQ